MKRRCLSLMLAVLSGIVVSASPLMAASDFPLWDSTVNQLLAAGLYGVDLNGGSPVGSVHFEQTPDLYKGLAADRARLNGQSITFSYAGSSGLLGFSAGYIYTSGADQGNLGSVYLGIEDPMGFNAYDPTKSWYIALDLSTSYQPNDDVVLGLGGKTMLFKDPYDVQQGGRMFSFLLNMPVSYKKFITITPELQWSRPLPGNENLFSGGQASPKDETIGNDVFYGGVSISFSY